MFSLDKMPSTTAVLSAYTTLAASAVLVRTALNEVRSMANQIIPKELQEKILSKLGVVMGINSCQMCIVIDEKNGEYSINEMFEAAELYLQTKITSSVKKLKLSKPSGEDRLSVTIGKGEIIVDTFEGIEFMWQIISTETPKSSTDYEGSFTSESIERRSFELSFNKKYMDKALTDYIPSILARLKAMKKANKVVNLHALGSYAAGSVVLNHPSTFDTLAMDPDLKKALIEDLDRFLERRDYYRRVGKAWKRGYLLYGPPGTGKSSLIAAMANYLKFDIYDMELASLRNNAELRRLLLSTKNRSIMVIEDIDCSIDLPNRATGGNDQSEGQLTLSGLLNFIDGLWSSCGDERIIVFTTNHKDKLDPALLRPGRMDMQIHMSYCSPDGFKVLASNYLGIKNHCKFSEIERLLNEVEATPAEIAEQLMRNKETDAALSGLVNFLNEKKSEQITERSEVNNKANEKEEVRPETASKAKRNKRKARRGANRRCIDFFSCSRV